MRDCIVFVVRPQPPGTHIENTQYVCIECIRSSVGICSTSISSLCHVSGSDLNDLLQQKTKYLMLQAQGLTHSRHKMNMG